VGKHSEKPEFVESSMLCCGTDALFVDVDGCRCLFFQMALARL
jgi:hypothetical protein